MKILFLDQFSELGGAQLCLLDLLPQPGWEAHAAVPGSGPFVDRLAGRGVTVHRLPILRGGPLFFWDLPAVAREIRGLVAKIDPAVVYVNGPRVMPAVAQPLRLLGRDSSRPPTGEQKNTVPARVPARQAGEPAPPKYGLGRPVIFHAHNRPNAVARWLVQRAVRRTRATVIAASRFVWDGHVIYGGIAGSPVVRRGEAIGLIGRFSPQKGQKQFVQAAALLPPDWRFILCGDAQFGETRYRDRVLAEAPPSVQYLGWRDDVYEVLADLSLLVVPSAGEGGAPRVILEAFAAGVPVLALDSGAIPEVVRDGENGFLLGSAAPQEIARRLRELVPQRERLEAVAERARREWEERFTVERYRREVWEAITAAAAGGVG